MNPVLSDEAQEFRAAAVRAFESLGGVDVARRAEQQPAVRTETVAPVLDALGAGDLDARAGGDSLAAAAVLCEAAGRVMLPYPVPGVLLADVERRPFAVVPAATARVDHGDLFPEWRVATVGGPPSMAARRPATSLGTRLGPFVADLGEPDAPGDGAGVATRDVSLRFALDSWQVLGVLARAVELAIEHVNGRVQFGKPLAAFQVVQFQLADAHVAVAGLRELALFTLWRLDAASPHDGFVDALALRAHALDVAGAVLRTCQQLHGAAGVCDEYDISVLCRHVQPLLRLPFGVERTVDVLATAIEQSGFDALFPQGGPAG